MRRAPGLVELSRREFCAFASAIAASLASCTANGPGAIATGGLSGDDDGNGNGPTDANGGGQDSSTGSGSGSGSGMSADACPSSGATDTGKTASAITTGTPIYVSSGKFFVIRDSGGLYAMTALCTHEGAVCDYESGQNDIYCPRHGATFDINGAVTQGPATKALKHYAMCTLASGNVGVITSQSVTATQRYNF